MESPVAVANYFIKKSFDDGTLLTPMKLLKLVYIAHGWHLGLYNEPLIGERIEAWKYGPVIPSIYYEFKKWGDKSIAQPAYVMNGEGQLISPLPADQTHGFLDEIWAVYKSYSGLQLSTLTHQKDTPWDITWNQEGGKEFKGAPIPNELIRTHYTAKSADAKA